MKSRLTMSLAFVVITASAFAQMSAPRAGYLSKKKGPLFGINFSLSDFTTPLTFKTSPTPIISSERRFAGIRDMSAGFSLAYWKGISNQVDFSTKVNAIFYDYAARNSGTTGKTEIGLEFEPTINIRPMSDDNRWAPFLTLGLGGGLYTNKIGAYAPVGIGFQLNFNSATYLFLQGQYHFTLTKEVLKDNLYYSLGLAENFGKEKVYVTPPPPPPPVVINYDRDGDGVPDSVDRCPDVAGLVSLQGCPDRDGDGIADIDDKCPDVAGVAKYNGCPIPDTDHDGINDEEDKCPTVPGVARYQGCPIPDRDGDGVNDEEDKCPDTPGPASNYGCPVIAPAVVEMVNKAAKNIFFATGSAKLLAKSFPSLNNVVKLLNDNPTYKVDINGYTDITGTAEKNQVLSENRAASVKAYFVSKGIDESRISSTGHGINNPIADNKTAAGRAKNRRVEMTVRNY